MLVLDANILLRVVFGIRVLTLLETYEDSVSFYTPDICFSDALKYIPITIPILVHLEGTTATARAHFVVPYIQWGLKDPSFLFWKTDKDVAIDLFLTGRLSQ
jgi:hypothetical protein